MSTFYALIEDPAGAQAAIYVDPSPTPHEYVGRAYCRGGGEPCRYTCVRKHAERIADAADLAKAAWSTHVRRAHAGGVR